MGVVLKGKDAALDRIVAVKVLAPQLATNEASRKRLAREARAAAAINHENVVAIHAVDEFGGLPFIVMEFVPGISLQEKLDHTGPLEVKEIVRIGQEIAAGLAAAHARGLIHRDIKPSNILLMRTDWTPDAAANNSTAYHGPSRIKITDFGLARAIDDASLTQTGVVAGTPQYMAPEQARAEPLDPRADLFSLGSLLYALCTGQPPFPPGPAASVLYTVCQDTPSAIQTINPAIPDWLAAIIAKLQAKNPADRFQTASEVAELFARYLAHLEDPERVPQPAALPNFVPPSPAQKRKALRLALAAALLFAIGLPGYLFGPAVFRIMTDQGEIEIKTDDAAIAVMVNKQGVKIHDQVTKLEYQLQVGRRNLKSGDYEIDVAELPNGVALSTTKFSLKRGGEIILTACPAPKPDEQIVAPAPLEKRGANLLLNSGFEDAADKDGEQPIYWIDEAKTTASEPEAQCYRDTTVKFRGQASVAVQKLPKLGVSKVVEAGFSQQLYQLPANETVYLSGYIKTRNVDGAASIKLRLMDKKGKWLGDFSTPAVKGSQDWTPYETTVKIPPDAQGAVILVLQGRGTVWFDEVFLYTEPNSKFVPASPKGPVSPPRDVAADTELLWNGGFEKLGADGPLCWKRYEPGIQGLTLKADRDVKRSGTASATIINTTNYSQPIGWRQDLSDSLPIGRSVTLTGWVKTKDSDLAVVCVQLLDAGGKMMAFHTTQFKTDFKGTADWKQFTQRFSVPHGTGQIAVLAFLKGRGQVWFDDFAMLVDAPTKP